ncbi:MAG: hypothetical protein WAO58_11100 [Fimbriimonadaceae bacterium]
MIALLALIPISYSITPAADVRYDVTVAFDGYLPLLGGREAKVDVQMLVDVKGLDPDDKGMPRASSEIADFSLSIDGSKFPGIGVDSVREYFPKTTISFSPQGKILKSDAPDIQLPFRLPGLDVKRFPDITYLPVEFPEAGIEEGKAFDFKKKFGDSDVAYTVTPTSIKDAVIEMDVKLLQSYEVFEDSGGNVIRAEADAVRVVRTRLTGSGKITFDRQRGLVSMVDIQAASESKVLEIRTKAQSDRKLKTMLKVKLKDK